jgi:FAD/FMN-containing dehydrogenase
MTDSAVEGVRLLREELGDRVALPGSAAYAGALGRVFFPDASRRRPSCVVQPASAGEVSSVMRIAQKTGSSVTVRGGGLSSNCVADGAVMVDLSAHMDHAAADGDVVVVGGGATMGTLLDALAPQERTVPIGIRTSPRCSSSPARPAHPTASLSGQRCSRATRSTSAAPRARCA